MLRFSLWIILPLSLFCILSNSAEAGRKKSKRPNILFIYTDDHSHRTVSCYSEAYPWAKTPHIDALAKTGIRFRYAYIGTWCMPSRATILTGHHPYGVKTMRMEGEYPGSTYDPKQCPFWPSVFRRFGYFMGMIGKWHTGVDAGWGRDWDFQKVWNRPKFPKNAGAYYRNQLIETNGGKAKLTKGYATDNYTKWAVDFIKGKYRDKDKPWFLWVCYGAVHGPFTPAKRHMEAYPNINVPTPRDIYPPRRGKPEYMQRMNKWRKNKDGQPEMRAGGFTALTVNTKGIHGNTLTDWVRQYHQGVLAIDEGVGQLIAALKESGQYENTLIIFTADQGFAWGQHGFHTKLAPYDSNMRTPMIISMPSKLPQGKVCETPVGGVDIAPTIFRFAKIKLPWKMHGHDLTPLLKNPKASWRHPVLLTLVGRKYGADTNKVPTDAKVRDIAGVPWWVFLVKGKIKYIRTLVSGEIEELYDLENDPEELNNLALQPKYAKLLKKFRSATIAELRRTGAGMVNNLPPVKDLHAKPQRDARRQSDTSPLFGRLQLLDNPSQVTTFSRSCFLRFRECVPVFQRHSLERVDILVH
ncbi:MAG: sulfatase-like hydrolase/transferase [Gemmataceae bacterium]